MSSAQSTDLARGGVQAKVRGGETPLPGEVLSFLWDPVAAARAERFADLAGALAEAGDPARAAVLARRAYAVSGYDARYLDRCLKLFEQTGDIEGIREALKRAGTVLAGEGRVPEALDRFNGSLYTYARHRREDRYIYDFEMLGTIEAMAAPYRIHLRPAPSRVKPRIAVLVFGALHIGSVVMRILAELAEHIDPARFEIAFFVPEARTAIAKSPGVRSYLALLERNGARLHTPQTDEPLGVMLETASAIHAWNADLLLTSALCADLRHYFIASTCPAPRTVALVLGPPAQFTAPWVDWNIAGSTHPALDTPGNCTVVPLEFALPSRGEPSLDSRETRGLPADAMVLLSAGRAVKFESGVYWRAVADVLKRHAEAVYLVMGTDDLPRAMREEVPAALLGRVRPVGWREDYLGTLALADIVLDTYPSGGGVVLLDAMALGIPVVSMSNDYLREFDQTDWAPASDTLMIPDLVVPRGDFMQWTNLVDRLITDAAARSRLAKECEAHMQSTRGSPARMVRGWEHVFERVIAQAPRERAAISPAVSAHPAAGTGRLLRWLRRQTAGAGSSLRWLRRQARRLVN